MISQATTISQYLEELPPDRRAALSELSVLESMLREILKLRKQGIGPSCR